METKLKRERCIIKKMRMIEEVREGWNNNKDEEQEKKNDEEQCDVRKRRGKL